MSTYLVRLVCVVFVSGVGALACAHESGGEVGYAQTTSALVPNDIAVQKVAESRCRRAAECNRIGAGQMYADKDDCRDRERDEATQMASSCTNGIDSASLDKCLDALENQSCQANMGRVAAMDHCSGYCARPR